MKLVVSLEDVQQAIANYINAGPPIADDVEVKPEHITILIDTSNADFGPATCGGAEIRLEF